MFTEILRIRPVLDRASAGHMENTLNRRFARVGQRFRGVMKNAIRGTVIGISLGLLAKILNPIKELEDKIKTLLGHSTELRDMADRFNTTPARMEQLKAMAASMSLTADQLKDMMNSFATAVETGRDEMLDPTTSPSATTQRLAPYLEMQDLVEGFYTFIQGLSKVQSEDVYVGERENRRARERAARGETLAPEERQRLIDQGLLHELSGRDARRRIEMDVFGSQQFGAARKFIDASSHLGALEYFKFDHDKYNLATQKASDLANNYNAMEAVRERNDYLGGIGQLHEGIVNEIVNKQGREDARLNRRLSDMATFQKAAENVEYIKQAFEELQVYAAQMMGLVGKLYDVLNMLHGSFKKFLINGMRGGKDN